MLQGKWTFPPITKSVHDNVAPNSTYTTSANNEFVMFPGSQISRHKDVLTVSNIRKPLHTEYKLHGHTLSRVTPAKYLGLTITNDLKWDIHINNICDKASRALSSLRNNLNIGSTAIKQHAYFTLIRPLVEYGSSV